MMVYVSNFRLSNWDDFVCFPNFSADRTGTLTYDVYTNDSTTDGEGQNWVTVSGYVCPYREIWDISGTKM